MAAAPAAMGAVAAPAAGEGVQVAAAALAAAALAAADPDAAVYPMVPWIRMKMTGTQVESPPRGTRKDEKEKGKKAPERTQRTSTRSMGQAVWKRSVRSPCKPSTQISISRY